MVDYVRGCRMVLRGKNVLNKDEGSYSVVSELAHTQDDQATSAPRETSVSMRTAVCIVLGSWDYKSIVYVIEIGLHVKAASNPRSLERFRGTILSRDGTVNR